MGLFKRNPFGHILFLKRILIQSIGAFSHRRYRGFNELQIEGSEIIKRTSLMLRRCITFSTPAYMVELILLKTLVIYGIQNSIFIMLLQRKQ